MPAQERRNRDTYLNDDERLIPITVTLYDADNVAVDLSNPGWAVKFSVWKVNNDDTITTIINDAAMSINADQVLYRGQATYITQTVDHGRPAGEYRWKARAEHSDGRKFEVPKQESKNYGRFFLWATN